MRLEGAHCQALRRYFDDISIIRSDLAAVLVNEVGGAFGGRYCLALALSTSELLKYNINLLFV